MLNNFPIDGKLSSPREIKVCRLLNWPQASKVLLSHVRHLAGTLLLALSLVLPLTSHAQGCSLCRDSTAGSPPHMRQALRRAILVLGLPAGAVFLGILLVAGKTRPREDLSIDN